MGNVSVAGWRLFAWVSPDKFRQRVAARIKKARWRLGWTQADAAFRIGLTFRYYSEVERGHRNPSLDTLLAIATALKVKVADLVDVEPGARLDLDAVKANPPKTGRKPTRPVNRRRR